MIERMAMIATALTFTVSVAVAQSASTTLERLTALDEKARSVVERGDAVTLTIEAQDKTEIATLGVVRLEVPRAFYVQYVHPLTGFLVSPSRWLSASFSDPARPEDVATLTLDSADAKALRKCQPLKCDVKLPAEQMQKFRAALDKKHDPEAIADSLMREWLVSYVNAYRGDSTGETVVYDDTKRPVRSSDAFRELMADPMPPGIDPAPFAHLLSASHPADASGVRSRISWEVDRIPGLKPTLEVLERSMYESPTQSDASWMSSKLLYATHYFESQVDFITVTDAPSTTGAAACYVIVLRRQKFDDLPSGGLFNIRGKAMKKLRDGLRSVLTNTRADIAKAFAESSQSELRVH